MNGISSVLTMPFLQQKHSGLFEAFAFIGTRRSRRAHLILLLSSLATGLAVYTVRHFQTLTIADLFSPSMAWLFYWVPVALGFYGSWVGWAVLVARWRGVDVGDVLERDALSYGPFILLFGVWLKHLEIPAVLPCIPAVAGFIALKLWSAHPYEWQRPWSVSGRVVISLLVGIMAAYGVSFSLLGWWRYQAFRTFADFGLFVQQVWGFSQFKMLFLTGVGAWPFGNHFSPILCLLAPLYWIWPNPGMLCIAQSTIMALGAVPVYWLARDRLDSQSGGMIFALLYLVYPAVQFPVLGDFHESVLIATPVLFAFYFLQRQQYGKVLLFVFLILFCKEDTGLIVTMLGWYAWAVLHHRRVGIGLISLGLVWFVVSIGVIMPIFQERPNWYLQFFMGSDRAGVASGSLAEQVTALIGQVVTRPHLVYVLELIVPLGGLMFLAPAELLLGVPTLLELLVYTGPPYGLVASIYSWHTAAVVPAMFIAAIYGMARLARWSGIPSIVERRVAFIPCLLFVLLCGALSSVAYGALPYSIRFRFTDFQVTPHDRIGHEVLTQIPPDASVSTTSQMYAHLSHRERVYVFPIPFKPAGWIGTMSRYPTQVEYVVVDTSKAVVMEMTESQREGFMEAVRALGRNPDYRTLVARDGYVIFQRNPAATRRQGANSDP